MLLPSILLLLLAAETEPVGRRPYEMEWAGRHSDAYPPLVDFEDLTGWRVVPRNSQARFEPTREQQIWGKHVGKLTYRGTGPGPSIRLEPPEPIAVPRPFDAVTLWVHGNNWGWAPDPTTPQVRVGVVLEDQEGREFTVPLYHVNWKEWYLLHRRLTPAETERTRDAALFRGIAITGGTNQEDRVLCFDNLAFFVEKFPPLKFEPRPRRGIPMLPGQQTGANTGPGRLPFPTRLQTILPENLTRDFETALTADGDVFTFTYRGSDGGLSYRLDPRTGTLGDVTARWEGRGGEIRPCVDGGVLLASGGRAIPPESAEPLGTRRAGEAVESRWRLRAAGIEAEVTYTYRLWGKALVVDIAAPGGKVAEFHHGRAVGLEDPRLVTSPFYLYSWRGARPAVAVSGPAAAPLFLAGHTDWCLSNASVLWADNSVKPEGVTSNGGSRYVPLMDGRRNDCHERLFITLSPRYEEVLPVIPNPPSPWKHVTGTRVWRAHGASNRERDKAFWRECHRYGMTQVVVTDHETGWRDGGESFTFRTKAAPGKGGDPGQYDYARVMQDELGFVYGPYNNFTDFAPVNEFWHFDMVSRTHEGQLQHAWMRCYAPKPARAVEYCARLAPEIERKFGFSTAYCDVHTAVAPWDRTDYDPRVPGAGTFAAVFYSFGEIMLHQKKAWDGPVYSEGTYHYLYCGLTDGNYGQDNPYRPWKNPWLVDFDLRRLHDLGCNFGMGNLNMFYGGHRSGNTPEERDAYIDRFLAATVAFGHPGFLVYEGGVQNALRSYYMLQQLHSRYCLASAVEIRYADSGGRLLDTSEAVASGAYRRSQVVTRYSDGTVTVVNGHPRERLVVQAHGRKLDLPPNGYAGWNSDGSVDVLSGERDGRRCDLAVTPAYIYVDGRGRFTRFPRAASNGPAVCRILDGGRHEIIPYGEGECGFEVPASTAKALDKGGREIGPASLRVSRGLTFVQTVEGAFSYVLSPTGDSPKVSLSCERHEVVPGETLEVAGAARHEIRVPSDARPGERIWREIEGAWIDFTVVPLARVGLHLHEDALAVSATSQLAEPREFEVRAAGKMTSALLEPGKTRTVELDLGAPSHEAEEVLTVELRWGGLIHQEERGLRILPGRPTLAALPERWEAGLRFRGSAETGNFGDTGAHVHPDKKSCGGVTRECIAMHPPYRGGVGYSFALYESVTLPGTPGAFLAQVGKADGSDPGDGILYRVAVVEKSGRETVAGEKQVTGHTWLPIEADLSQWAGKTIRLKLIADVGTSDNSSGDWACWSETRIVSLEPRLVRSLETSVEPFRRVPGPHPVRGLSRDLLRDARKGWIHYDGKGLSGTGKEYGSFAVLNGIELGSMAPAAGNETLGIFQEGVAVPISAEALQSLDFRNVFRLRNPRNDYFSVRRFWIELELADGRKCSSEISTATYSQPPEWPHSEGIGIPHGQDIRVQLWFPR